MLEKGVGIGLLRPGGAESGTTAIEERGTFRKKGGTYRHIGGRSKND